jgi:hypothetical protein
VPASAKSGRPAALLRGLCLAALVAWAWPAAAVTRLMEDIEIEGKDGSAQVKIGFTVPLNYLRHFPASQGEILNVFLQPTSPAGLRETLGHPFQDEVRRSPRSALLPCFTVTYVQPRGVQQDPVQLVIQFDRSVTYRLQPGTDGRSLVLHVEPQPHPAGQPYDCKTRKK